jgi:3-oxo-4-pregnene-20-carboxyl-CoA dehydrogenase alpha subunit
MNIDLSDEAVEYGRVAHRALAAAGGDELVRMAESEPERRGHLVEPVLGELGAWDLDPRGGGDELEAAAALCHAAGWWAVAYPVAERLCRSPDARADGTVVVADVAPAGRVAWLPERRWVAVTLDGRRSPATPRPSTEPPRRSGFVTALDLQPLADRADMAEDGTADPALGLVLSCWTLFGMLDRAMDLTRAYVLEREQFGQRLASFQGVQFQLTEAEVERAGVGELARYALWSVGAGQVDALADALALRSAAIEAADVVFRVAHQLHGAIGFCDEATLSWVSRHSQPLRRLPLGLSATRDELARRIGRGGLAGLFDAVAAST